MTTSTTTNPLIEEYVARCSNYLWDLSPELQNQLRDDIRQIVGEVAMELDGRPDDLVGPPVRFVAELRSAAGLPPTPAAPPPSIPPPSDPFWTPAIGWLRATAAPWLSAVLQDLRPAWWVARGLGLAYLVGAATSPRHMSVLPDLFGSQFLGVFSTVALIVASVRFGRSVSPPRLHRILWLAASVVASVALLDTVQGLRYPYSYSDASPVEVFADYAPTVEAGIRPMPTPTSAPADALPSTTFMLDPASGSAAIAQSWQIEATATGEVLGTWADTDPHELLSRLEEFGWDVEEIQLSIPERTVSFDTFTEAQNFFYSRGL